MPAARTFSTELDLQKLKAIDGKDTTYNDVKTPGLRVRISPRTGRKVFAYEYRPPGAKNATKRLLEGIETLKEARARVHELKAEINKGADPLAPPPPKITIRYIADQYRTIKKPSAEDWRCLETRILPAFGEHCALSLKTHQVSAWHSKITKVVKSKTADGQIKKEEVPAPHTADRALDIFKAMMNWAERQELKPPTRYQADVVWFGDLRDGKTQRPPRSASTCWRTRIMPEYRRGSCIRAASVRRIRRLGSVGAPTHRRVAAKKSSAAL